MRLSLTLVPTCMLRPASVKEAGSIDTLKWELDRMNRLPNEGAPFRKSIVVTSVGIGSRGLASSYFDTAKLLPCACLSTRVGRATSIQKSSNASNLVRTCTCQAGTPSTISCPASSMEFASLYPRQFSAVLPADSTVLRPRQRGSKMTLAEPRLGSSMVVPNGFPSVSQ